MVERGDVRIASRFDVPSPRAHSRARGALSPTRTARCPRSALRVPPRRDRRALRQGPGLDARDVPSRLEEGIRVDDRGLSGVGHRDRKDLKRAETTVVEEERPRPDEGPAVAGDDLDATVDLGAERRLPRIPVVTVEVERDRGLLAGHERERARKPFRVEGEERLHDTGREVDLLDTTADDVPRTTIDVLVATRVK